MAAYDRLMARLRVGEVVILELDEELAGVHFRAALHEGFPDGSGHLRDDRRLLARVDHALGANRALNLGEQHRGDVDGHDRPRPLLALAAARPERRARCTGDRQRDAATDGCLGHRILAL